MKILVAKDEAFNFIYPANIEALKRIGEVLYFSPLRDRQLPACDLLYLPGGYPELFAQELAQNMEMRQCIRDFAERGGRIFAECGGFMYLCQSIDQVPMCGVFPMEATMEGARLHLGYRQMTWNDRSIKGHEFHYSALKDMDLPKDIRTIQIQKSASGKSVPTLIYQYKQVVAGYTHWYWAETGFDVFFDFK